AEDVRIKYDTQKLKFIGFEEIDGIKLVKDIKNDKNGELRIILASKGESNIVNAKKILLKLKFKGINKGEAIVDVTKGRVSDGIEMEKDLTEEQCDQGKIIIEELKDVNGNGEFTLLDLAIDARNFKKDPKSKELSKFNTDIAINNAIDESDLLEIGKLMIDNPNYEPNKY
ncbi:MAG: cohesin domain-containing protein, partial [Paeniclostridium sordellii]|nr:cohesin domain-containing protein [Paeniclostridium sordellii]